MYRIFVAAFAVYAIVHSYRRFRAGQVSIRRMLLWIGFWAGAVAISWVPQTSDQISRFFGIDRGVNLFFFASILLLVYLVFTLYLRIEAMRREITQLVRILALRDVPALGEASANATGGSAADSRR